MAVPNTERGQGDGGFTLIELFVVIVVIGVLIAVGIPTLLGARDRASRTSAQAKVVQGIKTQKTFYTDKQEYTDDVDALHSLEPSLQFGQFTTVADMNADAQVLGKVYVRNDSPETVTLVARSPEGTCYWVRAEDARTYYASNDCNGEPATFSSEGW